MSSTAKIEVSNTSKPGSQGFQGWSPVLATITDGSRIVLKVIDWVGGLGPKPTIGQYIATTGLVADIASAIDIRGASEVGDCVFLTGGTTIAPKYGSKYISGDSSATINVQLSTITSAHGLYFEVMALITNRVTINFIGSHTLNISSSRQIGTANDVISYTTSVVTGDTGMILQKGHYKFLLAYKGSVLNIFIY